MLDSVKINVPNEEWIQARVLDSIDSEFKDTHADLICEKTLDILPKEQGSFQEQCNIHLNLPVHPNSIAFVEVEQGREIKVPSITVDLDSQSDAQISGQNGASLTYIPKSRPIMDPQSDYDRAVFFDYRD